MMPLRYSIQAYCLKAMAGDFDGAPFGQVRWGDFPRLAVNAAAFLFVAIAHQEQEECLLRSMYPSQTANSRKGFEVPVEQRHLAWT
jgi:hypothetical protein